MSFSIYTPSNWYWFIADDRSTVYSSAAYAYLPSSDPTYQTWAATNTATLIDTKENLAQVLLDQVMPMYFVNGMDVVSINTPALTDNYTLDQQTQSQITSIANAIAANRGLPGGETTFFFQGHEFTADDFLNFAEAAADFVYNSNQSVQRIVLTGAGAMPTQPVTIP